MVVYKCNSQPNMECSHIVIINTFVQLIISRYEFYVPIVIGPMCHGEIFRDTHNLASV